MHLIKTLAWGVVWLIMIGLVAACDPVGTTNNNETTGNNNLTINSGTMNQGTPKNSGTSTQGTNSRRSNNATTTPEELPPEIITEQDDNAFTVSTFHSISVYWSPKNGSAEKKVSVSYRANDGTTWAPGFPMKYNPIDFAKAGHEGTNPVTKKRYDLADYRGSLVHLKPNTTYLVKLQLDGDEDYIVLLTKTWSEEFKIKKTIKVGNQDTTLVIDESGNESEGYVLYDGTGSTIDVKNKAKENILLDGVAYIIVRGFTLKNATENGIRFAHKTTSRHIVIEDNDISGWGEKDGQTPFGVNLQAAIYSGWKTAVANTIIQRNKIHDPRFGSNSWAEMHGKSKHPAGPQAISIGNAYEGNLVIRYNEIWSSKGHYYNDVMGLGGNSSYEGFPGPDSDIYGNYIANAWDDGIEAEGSDANVRIWNNYIEGTYLGIGNAAVSIGPLYIWGNVFGKPSKTVNGQYGEHGPTLKLGDASKEEYMTGHTYFFHNTILQEDQEGYGGIGVSGSGGRKIHHFSSRNNIIQVRDEHKNSIAIRKANTDYDYDYDLLNRAYPEGHETHGIEGKPTYKKQYPLFDFDTMTGYFSLDPASKGINVGEILPGFSREFEGKGPDIGAQDTKTKSIVYGLKAKE